MGRCRWILQMCTAVAILAIGSCQPTDDTVDPILGPVLTPQVRLTVTPIGEGSVTPTEGTYPLGTEVPLTATPRTGYEVKAWTGSNDDTLTTDTNTVTLDGPTTVTVEFQKKTAAPTERVTLTVSVIGGHGTVAPTGGSYEVGTKVSLTTVAETGYRVKTWSGTDDDTKTTATNTLTMMTNRVVTVAFEKIPDQPATTYTLTTKVVGGHGTIAPRSGTYVSGKNVTLTATAESGYRVKRWTGTSNDASTAATNAVKMTANQTVTVEFELIPVITPTYTLSASVIGGHGSISPMSGTYDEGAAVTLTATPDANYRVKRWIGTSDDAKTSTTNSVTMSADRTVSVEFELVPVTTTYTLTASVIGGHGSVSPMSETYDEDAVVTLAAMPDANYRVKQWIGTDDDATTSTTNSVTMSADRTVSVEFELIPIITPTYALSASAIGGHGSVSPTSGTYDANSVVALIATPESGYRVAAWAGTDSDPATGSNSVAVTMSVDRVVAVTFEPIPTNAVQLNCIAMGTGGTITPSSGIYDVGTIVSLTARADDNFELRAWSGTDDDTLAGNANTVTMHSDRTVVVAFGPQRRTLTTHVVGDGSIAPTGGEYDHGTVVGLVATPADGHRVKSWSGSDDDASLAPTNAVTMSADKSVAVEFEPITYTLTTSVNGSFGTIEPLGSSIRNDGEVVTLTAAPESGYRVKSWSGTDDDASTATTNTVTMSANRVVSVTFERITHTLTCSVQGGMGTLSPASGSVYSEGTIVALMATPASGYGFGVWSGSDDDTKTTTTNTVTMTTDRSVAVSFTRLQYTLSVSVVGGHGSVSPSEGTYDSNTTVTLTATAESGYRVKAWVGTTNDASTSATNSVAMTGNKQVFVSFEPVTYTLTTSVVGGHGSISPATSTYTPDAVVTLTATPENGYRVKAWTGTSDNASTATTNSVTMTMNKTVTVKFEIVPVGTRHLSASVVGGHGSVSPTNGDYTTGSIVELTAMPESGYRVKEWIGTDVVPLAGTCDASVTMSADKNVTVEFEAIPENGVALTATVVGGHGTIRPTKGNYNVGTVISLLARPDSGYRVKAWTGSDDDTSTTTTNAVTMTTAKTVSVAFEAIPIVATPTFLPATTTFQLSTDVTIACATGDATIYYTLDGTTPSATSSAYDGTAIHLTETTTVKAIAVATGYVDSAVATQTYNAAATSASKTIGTSGATLTFAGPEGNVSLVVPANAVSGDTSFAIARVDVPTPWPDGMTLVGEWGYQLTPDATNFAKLVTVTLPVVGGVQTSTPYALMRYDGTAWHTLSSMLDASAGTISAQTSHFSTFAVFTSSEALPCDPIGETLVGSHSVTYLVESSHSLSVNAAADNEGVTLTITFAAASAGSDAVTSLAVAMNSEIGSCMAPILQVRQSSSAAFVTLPDAVAGATQWSIHAIDGIDLRDYGSSNVVTSWAQTQSTFDALAGDQLPAFAAMGYTSAVDLPIGASDAALTSLTWTTRPQAMRLTMRLPTITVPAFSLVASLGTGDLSTSPTPSRQYRFDFCPIVMFRAANALGTTSTVFQPTLSVSDQSHSTTAAAAVTAKPTFSPAGGTFTTTTDVTISCASVGATVHYTIDGTTPTIDSPIATGAITLNDTATVKAIAMHPCLATSDVGSVTFTKNNSIDVTFYRVSDTSGTAHTDAPGVAKTTFAVGETVRITMKAVNEGDAIPALAGLKVGSEANINTLIYDSHDATKTTSGTIEDIAAGLATGETRYYSFDFTIPSTAEGRYLASGTIRSTDNYNTLYDTTLAGINSKVLYWSQSFAVYVPVSFIGAGATSSFAARSTGTLHAWGDNSFGQLGTSTTTTVRQPTKMTDATNTSMLSGGFGHTLAAHADGTLWATGRNNYGQLGDGTTAQKIKLTRITGAETIAAVVAAMNGQHSLALTTDKTILAWGLNGFGQLGLGDATLRTTPTAISTLSNVTAVSAGGYHSLACTLDGTLYAWGANSTGQLGNGTNVTHKAPLAITALTNIVAVAAGEYHSVALDGSGNVWTWGYNNRGQLGNGTTVNASTPIQVTGLPTIVAIAAGGYHTLARAADGTVYAWGKNSAGQLGVGNSVDRTSPTQITAITNVTAMAAGSDHTVFLGGDGKVRACGLNTAGQLGDNTTSNRFTPVEVVWP